MNAHKQNFLAARNGTVAIEFAFIAPVLIVLFLGTIELCNALVCREKVTTVAASAADLVAQDATISQAQMNDVFAALNAILYPYPTSSTHIIITSVKSDPNHAGQYLVDWSVPYNTIAHIKGAPITLPSGLMSATTSTVILTEVTYTYTPPSTSIIHTSFTMSDSFYSHPRKGSAVIYTG